MERATLPWSIFWHPTARRLGTLIYPYLLQLGWVWPFMFSFGALAFTPWDQLLGVNPLHWRSFGPDDPLMQYMHAVNGKWADFSNHHTLNLGLEAALSFGLAAWFGRQQRSSLLRWGLLASYGAILTWSIHEGVWWLTYWAIWKPSPIVFSGFGEILTVGLLILTPGMGLYQPRRFILWMAAFQIIWVFAGFPITESYGGQTILYGTIRGDGWEVASWLWACVGFYWLERDGLLGWYVKVERIIKHDIELDNAYNTVS